MRLLPPGQRTALGQPTRLISTQAQPAIQGVFTRFESQGHQLCRQFLYALRAALDADMDRAFQVGPAVALDVVASAPLLWEITLEHDGCVTLSGSAAAAEAGTDPAGSACEEVA